MQHTCVGRKFDTQTSVAGSPPDTSFSSLLLKRLCKNNFAAGEKVARKVCSADVICRCLFCFLRSCNSGAFHYFGQLVDFKLCRYKFVKPCKETDQFTCGTYLINVTPSLRYERAIR